MVTLSGKVTHQDTPVPYVNIFLKGTKLGTSTDVNGQFIIQDIPLGTYTVFISSIGFETLSSKLSLIKPLNVVSNFQLVENTSYLEEVVISGTMKEVSKQESPVPVKVYGLNFFKANPSPSVFESLQNINGVRPQLNCNICNTGDIHINGLDGPYTMVLIDGMPIVSGLSTVYGLTGIPQSLIERVEIVKGPASTLYGSEALGGLINIITKKISRAPLFISDVFSSDWGELNYDLGVKFDYSEKVQSLFGVNYFNYQNPIDNNNDGFTDLTLQHRVSIFNKLNFNRKDNRLFSIAGRYVYEDRWGGAMNWEKKYRGGEDVYGESIFTNRWETIGSYQLPFKEIVKLQFSANGHYQNSVYGTTIYNATQYIGFAQMTWNKNFRSSDLLLGIAYRYTLYDDNTQATNGINKPNEIHLPGIFIQNEIKINKQNKLLLGLRHDYNSIHGNILTPRLNYKWNSSDKKNIFRISAGNGFRVANIFTEDHAALTGARSVEFEGKLNPERSWNVNLNFVKKNYFTNGFFLGIDSSVFYTYFNNRILPDYDTDPNKIIYGNLEGSSVSKGIALNLNMLWISGLKILAGATLMDVSVKENGERFRQPLTESFQSTWGISYELTSIGLVIDYTGNLYGPMRLPLLGKLDPRPEYSPWWSIQNIQLTKTFSNQWEIYGGVKNLLDFTPDSNSIARPYDPFDQNVVFGNDGQVIPTAENPYALTFDPSYVYAANQGTRGFIGIRYTLKTRM
ncbi:MAG: TonB-dependent receptor [Flavobacteriaceae bacterium]|nr:TonB-dependent receptor [Flavobacteriaceae bacterium]|tara:strand:+ start:339 stop:2552 length:2214 start_codon:yes stop_codon:yes gene_type:complete